MNAYLITEDSESKIWIATTMSSALELAWLAYCKELDELEESQKFTVDNEREHYEQNILESCAHIAEVANP